jgi:hypothetical protein
VRAKAYAILTRAIEDGLEWGWSRAHKHNDNPDREAVLEAMYSEVLNSICEVFDFDDNIATSAYEDSNNQY